MYPAVFISYNSHDEVLAKKISLELDALSISNWFAPNEIEAGSHYAGDITPAIAGCDMFLLLASKYSIGSVALGMSGSHEVVKEIQIASNNRRYILPLKLDSALEGDYDSASTYHLSTAQWFDVSQLSQEMMTEQCILRVKELLEKGVVSSESFLANSAANEQTENIKKVEKALKVADTATAQTVLLQNKFAKQYDTQVVLLKIITSMMKNNIRNLQTTSTTKLLSQLNSLNGSQFTQHALYLKAILSTSYFQVNGVFDETGGFSKLHQDALFTPKIAAKYIIMFRHINCINIELRWKHL